MRNSLLFKTLFVGTLLALLTPVDRPLAQAPVASPAKSCLWKVTSKGGNVYLLGSVHLLRKDAYPLNQSIEQAFTRSTRVVLEVDMDESAASAQLLLSKGLLPGQKTLKEILSADTFKLVKQKMEAQGSNIETMQRFKPWLLMLTLTISEMQRLGYDAQYGIDKHFYDRARKSSKEVLSLETAEYQINLLDSLPAATQEAALLQTLKEFDLFQKEFSQIVKAWSSGDATGLEASLLGSFNEYPDVYEKLLLERNRNWIPKIEAFLGSQSDVLVIVGAAHLVGPSGVVELLRKKGYSVEQM
jgi:uncharacterized protein YbaP (TraB family)